MRRLLAIIALLSPITAFAYDDWSKGAISSVRVQGNYERVLLTQVNQTNPGGCSNSTYLYLQIEDTTSYDSMYSAILTGFAAKKEVHLALTGCSGVDKSGYPVITEVWVLD